MTLPYRFWLHSLWLPFDMITVLCSFFMRKEEGNSVFQNDQKLVVIIIITVNSSKLQNLSLVIACTYWGLLLNLIEPFQVSLLNKLWNLEEFSTAELLDLYISHPVFPPPPTCSQSRVLIRIYLCHNWTSAPASSCPRARWAGQVGIGVVLEAIPNLRSLANN